MIDMLVCGLMMWYHVDCIQFYFYETDTPVWVEMKNLPGDPWWEWYASSEIKSGIGIVQVFHQDPNFRDACGNTILEHELQRFHQKKINDFYFCNVYTNEPSKN